MSAGKNSDVFLTENISTGGKATILKEILFFPNNRDDRSSLVRKQALLVRSWV